MYDALAPYYRKYSAGKASYLDAIDDLIIARIPPGARSLLDIGAGDGVRAAKIAHERDIPTVVLVEPSQPMRQLCQLQNPSEIWPLEAQHLPDGGPGFDVITCLWNVLGHIPTFAERQLALQKMAGLLNPAGVLFFDVNNRHNAASYGWRRVAKNYVSDLLSPDPTHGDVSFQWSINGATIAAMGHLFTPAEVTKLLAGAGLRVRRRAVVDYRHGREGRFVFQGQLLYETGLG
jgi:2-polyprenyl-3-methyl-5-hydroxy-6-metoxy-1,4-benzoquinol methylase